MFNEESIQTRVTRDFLGNAAIHICVKYEQGLTYRAQVRLVETSEPGIVRLDNIEILDKRLLRQGLGTKLLYMGIDMLIKEGVVVRKIIATVVAVSDPDYPDQKALERIYRDKWGFKHDIGNHFYKAL